MTRVCSFWKASARAKMPSWMACRSEGDLGGKFALGVGSLFFVTLIAASDKDGAGGQVAGPDFHPEWHALLDPFPSLVSAGRIAPVDFHTHIVAIKLLGRDLTGQFLAGGENRVPVLLLGNHGNDNDVSRRHARGKNEAVVIGVGHDKRTDQAGAHAPARGPGEFLFAFAGEVLNAGGVGKILAEEV